MPRTVLIVDDHAHFRRRARRALELDGWLVVGEASDGATALASAQRLGPALVLLDVGLPDSSGFAIAAALRGGDDPPAVVLTSTHDAADFGALARRSRAAGFLPKADLSGAALDALLAQL